MNNAISIEEVDIEKPENKAWFDMYKWDIPAGHVDGEEIFRHRITEAKALEVYNSWREKKHNINPKEDL